MSVSSRLSSGALAAAATLASAGCATELAAPPATTAEALAASCNNGVVDAGELCPGDSQTIFAAANMRAVVAVDLNGDGRRDAAGISANRVYVRLRTATGWGTSWTWSLAGVDYRDIAAGNFDGDGDMDLVVADFANDRVLVHWNAGGGALAAPVAYAMGDGPVRVLAARLDLGVRADVVTLDRNSMTATVRPGGAGVLGGSIAYPVGDAPDIALGDCNGDTWLDLLYSSGTGTSHQLRARRGHDVLVFDPPIGSLVPLPPVPPALMDPITNPLAIVAGDLDGDVIADAVVTADGSWVVPATSNGNCTFTATPWPLTQTWAYALRPDLVDLDADGALDLLAPHLDDAVSTVFGAGDGSFPTGVAVLLPELYLGAPPNVYDIAPADVTGDGVRDFVIATSAGLELWQGVP